MYQWRIKLHRSSQDNVLYFSEPFTKRQARQDMILLTNHKDWVIVVRWNIIEVKRGQLWYSEDTISKRWQWSRNKTRRFLNYLETIQQIEQHKSKVKSLITIKNYDKFQGNDTTESTTDGHQTIQQTDTNKNDNNDKEWKEQENILQARSKWSELLIAWWYAGFSIPLRRSDDLEDARNKLKKKKIWYDDYVLALRRYAKDITERDKTNSYWKHRFKLLEFLTRKWWLVTFI